LRLEDRGPGPRARSPMPAAARSEWARSAPPTARLIYGFEAMCAGPPDRPAAAL